MVDDQYTAAVRESASIFGRLTQHVGSPTYSGSRCTWARRLIEDRCRRLAAGDPTLARCRHMDSPCPIVLVTWATVAVCAHCLPAVPVAVGDEDRRCDACDAVVELIHPVWVGGPPVLVVGGLCETCLREQVGKGPTR